MVIISKVMVNCTIIIRLIKRESGKIITYMDKEHLLIVMETSIKDNGVMGIAMDKENLL